MFINSSKKFFIRLVHLSLFTNYLNEIGVQKIKNSLKQFVYSIIITLAITRVAKIDGKQECY